MLIKRNWNLFDIKLKTYSLSLLKYFLREIVGFINEIEDPNIVGKTQHYQLLKFLVNNNNQHRVQVVV